MLLQRVLNRGIGLGTLLERAAARHPGNTVVLDRPLDTAPELGRRPTVPELAGHVDDVAARLAAAGVRPRERVVVHKTDNFDITLLACAVARAGGVPVLLSPALDGETVVALLRRAERPRLLTDGVTLTERLPAAVFDKAADVLLAAGTHRSGTALADVAPLGGFRPPTLPPDHPTLVTHTSGTTGLPKLAVHTSRTLQARYRPQAAATSLVRKREVVAIHVSFVHSRLFTALAITLLRGCPLVVLTTDDSATAADLFSATRPGVIEAHPNSFMQWEDLADDRRRPLAAVKYFSSTFDALHPRTVQRMLAASERRRPRFAQLYGQSEVGPVVGRTSTASHRTAEGRCVGFPFPGMTGVRVVSRDEQPPSKESPGFIEVSTDGRIVTYLGEDERYDRQLYGRWWRMGDLGYRTRRGCLHLLDREVDEISGFGSTLAAEDVLFASLDQLTEVVIVPTADGRTLPVVCTKGDVTLDPDAWRAASATLPPMGQPVHLRLEEFPRTATTKVKRLELARRLGDRFPSP